MTKTEILVILDRLCEMVVDLQDMRTDDRVPLHLSAMAERHIDTTEAAIRELRSLHGISA